jgi:hypothetical protein
VNLIIQFLERLGWWFSSYSRSKFRHDKSEFFLLEICNIVIVSLLLFNKTNFENSIANFKSQNDNSIFNNNFLLFHKLFLCNI